MSLEEVIGYVASDELIKVVYALFIQIVFPVFIFCWKFLPMFSTRNILMQKLHT